MKYFLRLSSIIIVLALMMTARSVEAASLYFRMAKTSYKVGESDFATLNIDTQDKTANAISATITFDPTLIQITGTSTDKSIIDMWIESAVIDNTQGTLTFKGVVFNPAFKGSLGRLIGFDFTTKTSGTFPFSVASFQVLANDGKGSVISTSPVTRAIAITSLNDKAVSVQPDQKKDTTPPSSNTITVLPRQDESILPTIRAKATDAKSGIAFYEVWANGKKLTRSPSLEGYKLKNLKVGKNSVEIKAIDKAGNVRSDKISVLYNPLPLTKIPISSTPITPHVDTPTVITPKSTKPKTQIKPVIPVIPKIKAPVLFN